MLNAAVYVVLRHVERRQLLHKSSENQLRDYRKSAGVAPAVNLEKEGEKNK